jgi:predicted transcriptional regulator
MAMPMHKPTEASRAQVEALCGYGITEDEIASYIGIDPKTLRKHYRREIDTAVVKANALVARSLHGQATSGNVSAAIFWLKVRAGWSEKSSLELTGAGGLPLNGPPMTKDELREAVQSAVRKF